MLTHFYGPCGPPAGVTFDKNCSCFSLFIKQCEESTVMLTAGIVPGFEANFTQWQKVELLRPGPSRDTMGLKNTFSHRLIL